jgi:Tfp pilus assembly protein FimV
MPRSPVDSRDRARMLRNKCSARRHRERKSAYIAHLEADLAKLREELAQKDAQIALHTAELARKDPQLALNTTEDVPLETMQHELEDDFVAELDVAMWTGDVLVTFDA